MATPAPLRQRSGLESLHLALDSGLENERAWALHLLLAISCQADCRIPNVAPLARSLVRLLRDSHAALAAAAARVELSALSAVLETQQLARQIVTVVRNLSFMPDVSNELAAQPDLLSLLVDLLASPDDEIAFLALESFGSLAHQASPADAAQAMPEVMHLLRSDDTETVTCALETLLQFLQSPHLSPDFLPKDLSQRPGSVDLLIDFLLPDEQPELQLAALQLLHSLSLSPLPFGLPQNAALIKRLVYYVTAATRSPQAADEELVKKAALLLQSLSRSPASHAQLRSFEQEVVTGAALLGTSPAASALLNALTNMQPQPQPAH